MDTRDQSQDDPEAVGEDYLWDRSGKPDAGIQKLETLLGKFRHDRPTPRFPAVTQVRWWRSLSGRMRLLPSLAAATGLATIAILIFTGHRDRPAPAGLAGWDVSHVTGTFRIGNTRIREENKSSRLGVGQTLETDSESRARLHADDIGQIEVAPNTRLRLLTMSSGLKRIALDHGTIHAFIWATPGQFVVDTPSATTVDLGCSYTLQVDDSGAGLVRTSLGWVGFKLNGNDSFIPAGAACSTRPKIGPGTPYFEDASGKLREALARFDFEDDTPHARAADVAIVLSESRKRDALTLWHLLSRVDDNQRELIYARLKKLAPPPVAVTKEGILQLNRQMLDSWWNALGFDDIAVWRHWERSWSGAAK